MLKTQKTTIMKQNEATIRESSALSLIISSIIIVIVVGVQYYMGIQQNVEDAKKLVKRDLQIVEMQIMSTFLDAEFSMDEMHDALVDNPNNIYQLRDITRKALKDNDFLKAAAIAFAPNFFPEKGYWYEPRTIRKDGRFVSEDIGGPNHDYTKMDWYISGEKNVDRHGKWSHPYVDESQDNAYVMSLTQAVRVGEKFVGVICLDMELSQMKKLLREAEPYKGSVCQLIDKDGHILATSDDFEKNVDYFIDSKEISMNDMVVKLACPKDEIYGDTKTINTITLFLLFIGLAVLLYIVRHAHGTMTNLKTVRERQQMTEREMHIAHEIQMQILRRDFPDELNATLLPMREVGGDLYDYYMKDKTIYFIIGDVSGKGIPAAMMMAATVTLFRMATRHVSTPAEIMTELNRILSEGNSHMMFVTAFIGKIDLQHGLLTYCNAGHNPPVLNGDILNTDPDIPLGYEMNYEYQQHGILFPKGSQIVLYTDGITESRNQERKLMGLDRLQSLVNTYHNDTPAAMVPHIIDETIIYAHKTEQVDDMTLMCITNDTAQQSPALIITNDIEELQRVKSLLRDYCQCLGCERRLIRKILLAVEEALANIVNYAYPKGHQGRIDLDLEGTPAKEGRQTGQLTVRLIDYGAPFDPTEQKKVDINQRMDDRQIGGLGIYLYQQLMDTVTYQRTEEGSNVLTMTKVIGIEN
jgi:anti-sigma regulatory factor (Ser/Thr protein kinase)